MSILVVDLLVICLVLFPNALTQRAILFYRASFEEKRNFNMYVGQVILLVVGALGSVDKPEKFSTFH
jgi:hypothetical protein